MSGVRAALFLDFDNIYTAIAQHGQEAAEEFATNPWRWFRWLESGDPATGAPTDPATPRRILSRNCYLNPRAFGRYRSDFTRAGFRVVDCPPLTRQHKTSTDIHMVMDVLDTLDHKTHFDEFILLSGDADFTPLLTRLRAHDRRIIVLAVGPTAAAYRSVVDTLCSEDDFLRAVQQGDDAAPRETALRYTPPRELSRIAQVARANLERQLTREAPSEAEAAEPEQISLLAPASERIDPELLARMAEDLEREAALGPVAARALPAIYRKFPEFRDSQDWLGHWGLRALTAKLVQLCDHRLRLEGDGEQWYVERTNDAPLLQALEVAAKAPVAGPSKVVTVITSTPEEQLAGRLRLAISRSLEASPKAITLVAVAQELQKQFGSAALANWAGFGNFRAFLEANLPEGAALDQLSATEWVVRDTARHLAANDVRLQLPEPRVIERICRITGVPALSPHAFKVLFEAAASHLETHDFAMLELVRHVRESAATAGVVVSRSNAQFVIKGLPAAELTALKQSGRLTGIAIGQLFRDQISNLCEDAALQLSSEESTAIDGWVLGAMGEGSLP